MSSSSTWTAVPGSIVGWSVTQISWLAIRIGRDELMDHWPWKGDRMNCEAILSPPAVWEIYFAAMILSTKKSIVHIPDRQHVVELLFKHFHELNKYDNICEWMCWILRFTFAFCVFWSDVESFKHVPGCASQPIPLCQVLAIQEVNDDPWTCISHFEYTCNPLPKQNQQRTSSEHVLGTGTVWGNWFGESIVVHCAFAEESGKYCVLLRKAATYLVTNKGNIQASMWCHTMSQYVTLWDSQMPSCANMCMSCHFVFAGEEWQCRSDGRHFGHGALGGATDLRHRARPSSHWPTLWGRRKGKNFCKNEKLKKIIKKREKAEFWTKSSFIVSWLKNDEKCKMKFRFGIDIRAQDYVFVPISHCFPGEAAGNQHQERIDEIFAEECCFKCFKPGTVLCQFLFFGSGETGSFRTGCSTPCSL